MSGKFECNRERSVEFDHSSGGEGAGRAAVGDLVVKDLGDIVGEDRTDKRIGGRERDSSGGSVDALLRVKLLFDGVGCSG